MEDNRRMESPKRPDEGQHQLLSLARQGSSMFDLSMEDALRNVGKPNLNGLNMDELFKTMISVEEGQPVQNPSSSSSCSSSSSPAPLFLGNLNLNGMLSKKTVDEVWKDLVHQEQVNAMDHRSNIQQQIGETTLEDFLVRAGVINMGGNMNQNGMVNSQPSMVATSQPVDWLQFQMAAAVQQHRQPQQQHQVTMLSEAVFDENPVVEVGFSDNQMAMPMPMPAIPATSSESQTAAEKKRRHSDEMMEKSIERRQKRMIKNRESAARSRARKQAYTNQLELDVIHLRKTNSWLKKQKEVETLLSCHENHLPRYQLRRTSSSLF